MVASVSTVSFQGIEVRPVDVQVQISNGLPAFNIVGLPDKAVAESKERVRAALHSLGIALPPKRLTVNMAPADLAKEGSHFDLPIALGVLAAMEVIPEDEMLHFVALGELALDATLRPVAGVLPAAMHASAQEQGLICPHASGQEAAWAGEIEIIAPKDLLQLINHLKGTQLLSAPEAKISEDHMRASILPDLSDVKGQESAKRALEIAAAGGHNLLMIGPPGSGKSMLARCMAGILPPMTPREALEISMIHSIAGTLPEGGLLHQRPFRDPHHSASLPSLVGGGHRVKPGEISLAHQGVLFLDELPEFARATLESLRQPLESGEALIARANHHVRYPADFQLVAAMNPCRCGHFGDADLACNKAPRCVSDYQAKISGPMLDRMDLVIDVPAVSVADLTAPAGESTHSVAERVLKARNFQKNRAEQAGVINANLQGQVLDHVVRMDDGAQDLLNKAMDNAKFSARGYYRLLRVARTIADLDNGADMINKLHVAEALSYRRITLS